MCARACATDLDEWLSISDARPFDGIEQILRAAVSFKKKGMDEDLEMPEGCKRDAIFVTAAEFGYVAAFAQCFIATGKGFNDSGMSIDEINKTISRLISQVTKIKLADVVKESRVLPFRPALPKNAPSVDAEA